MKNKCFFISGGAKRIGRACVMELASMGYDIALHYNTSESAALQTQQDCQELGVRCELIKADLNSTDSVQTIMDTISRSFDSLAGMIHSASVFSPISFEDASADDWYENMTVNMLVPVLLSQAFTKTFSTGQIIHFLDADQSMNTDRYFPYTLSKRAFESVSMMMARTLAPKFRVNAIAPGWILEKSTGEPDDVDALTDHVPLQTQGSISDIQQAVRFLVAEPYITGQIIYVDGGRHLN